MKWMTEITHVQDNTLFVDEQRIGPYKLWHHQHRFQPVDNGVLMTDIVHYSLPFSFIGNLAHALFVRKKLEDIFDYRYEKIEIFLTKNKVLIRQKNTRCH
jgi:ligand-binding SRPBCC domain-containing protein